MAPPSQTKGYRRCQNSHGGIVQRRLSQADHCSDICGCHQGTRLQTLCHRHHDHALPPVDQQNLGNRPFRDCQPQRVYGGEENGLGNAHYVTEKVPLDRSQEGITRFYPEGVRAKRLKPMYQKSHPLSGLDTMSFGKPTEGVTQPKYPKK